MIDDLSVIQQKDNAVQDKNLHVFNVNPAYRMDGGFSRTPLINGGANPPNGVVFNYWLKDVNDSSKASIKIFDKYGNMVKTYRRNEKGNAEKLNYKKG